MKYSTNPKVDCTLDEPTDRKPLAQDGKTDTIAKTLKMLHQPMNN
jgi:hypothetical protein